MSFKFKPEKTPCPICNNPIIHKGYTSKNLNRDLCRKCYEKEIKQL